MYSIVAIGVDPKGGRNERKRRGRFIGTPSPFETVYKKGLGKRERERRIEWERGKERMKERKSVTKEPKSQRSEEPKSERKILKIKDKGGLEGDR